MKTFLKKQTKWQKYEGQRLKIWPKRKFSEESLIRHGKNDLLQIWQQLWILDFLHSFQIKTCQQSLCIVIVGVKFYQIWDKTWPVWELREYIISGHKGFHKNVEGNGDPTLVKKIRK